MHKNGNVAKDKGCSVRGIRYEFETESESSCRIRLIPSETVCGTEKPEWVFRLFGENDFRNFVTFLNENQVEPAHIRNVYEDFVYSLVTE